MPNRDLSDPELPADPEKLEEGEWSWKGCYQPLRWFFCPCVLHKHDCAFTGEPPAECTGWHDFCCKEVCAVLLSGGPFSCLLIARSVPMGPKQILCTLGRFVPTCTKARYAHGDCYVIFGTALTWKPRASSTAYVIIGHLLRRTPLEPNLLGAEQTRLPAPIQILPIPKTSGSAYLGQHTVRPEISRREQDMSDCCVHSSLSIRRIRGHLTIAWTILE